MDQILSLETLSAALRLSTPIVFLGIAGLASLQSGDINVALEGMMLVGAFFAVVGSHFFESCLVGVVFAVVSATIFSLLFGVMRIKLKADAIIVGFALNLLALGLTTFLMRVLLGVLGSFSSDRMVPLPTLHIPLIDSVPVVGGLLNNQSVLVYVALLLVGVSWVVVYRTPFGRHLRATGEHPEAIETAGISSERIRWIACLICGVLCGLAGAHLSIGYLLLFSKGMSGGRGFIALAAIIFSPVNPIGVWIASLFFGLVEGLSLKLQGAGNVPARVYLMFPYVATVVALVVQALRVKAGRRRRMRVGS